jgi:serine/threonine protein kinase/Tol biopolymer transport system component
MALTSGTRIGSYEIRSLLGAGGMGEVYRSRDSKLGREVALKVLPSTVAGDSDRLGRFSREAKVLAALNHPNIAAIYGLEDSGTTHALVMELVEGPTLAERIKAGPIASEEALPIAKQICEALEYAHERGIVHRDLKPSNIKVTPEVTVKVLDFGLAKALENDGSAADVSSSPTMSRMATQAGIILGTAAYMSPEQARGKAADRRADIWAFGCVLYEMLTGEMAFSGETVSDVLAAVIKEHPNWAPLPATTSTRIRVLVQRCLQKDPRQRLQAIGDARIVIDEVLSGAPDPTLPALQNVAEVPASGWRLFAPWGVGGLILGALVAGVIFMAVRPQVAPRLVRRLTIGMPPSTSPSPFFPDLVLSPDGTEVVYSLLQNGKTQLYLRPLDQFEAKAIAGTEGAYSPFFSPDGRSLAFFAGTSLKKVDVAGGPVQTLCSSSGAGANWAADGTIFFQGKNLGLSRVASAGGNCEEITKPDASKGEVSHDLPELLPGGEAVLFNIGQGFSSGQVSIAVLSLKTRKWQNLVQGGIYPHYIPGGYLVYTQGGALLAVPFDLAQLKVTGSPVPIVDGVMTNPDTGEARFTLSRDGTLAYIPGSGAEAGRKLVLVNQSGTSQVLTQSEGAYEDLSLSPDGRRVALTVEGPTWNIWIYEIPRGTLTRFTFENDNRDPFWTPDGKRVVYTSFRNGKYGLYWKAADGSGGEEQLISDINWLCASSFSSDGKELAYIEQSPDTGIDIWILSLDGERKPRPFLRTRFKEWFPEFSPDGHWLAYESDESGRFEIYVQQYPGPGRKVQISNEGGARPVWSHDGRTLFYAKGDKLMRVPIETKTGFAAGTAQQVFQGNYYASGHYFDVMPDGKQFVFIKEMEQARAATQINLVLNWFDELKQRMRESAKR